MRDSSEKVRILMLQGLLRSGPDIVGIPPRKVEAMRMNEAQIAAQKKRQRKMGKRK